MNRRRRLCLALPLLGATRAWSFDPVSAGYVLRFPRDRGAHPGHRIEWWYVTGHLETRVGPAGFQVTFFRVRNKAAEALPGRFSPRQVLFAHAALVPARETQLVHAQRAARALDGAAYAREGETDVRIDHWFLRREGERYVARLEDERFGLWLSFEPTQPVLLQGEAGFSRKGPSPRHASHYYSEPHLRVTGNVRVGRAREQVRGVAWLDHEWSSEPLAEEATGWDWLGLNVDGGAALTAFRVRDRAGGPLWSTATWRDAGRDPVTLASPRFRVLRTWTSPRTRTQYPVEMEIETGRRTWRVTPLVDDQELDARASTGTLYWEGAVLAASSDGHAARGYLELTGYAERVPF